MAGRQDFQDRKYGEALQRRCHFRFSVGLFSFQVFPFIVDTASPLSGSLHLQ
jgi:hypothetical protein